MKFKEKTRTTMDTASSTRQRRRSEAKEGTRIKRRKKQKEL
jgi:hypothetical protein